MREANKL